MFNLTRGLIGTGAAASIAVSSLLFVSTNSVAQPASCPDVLVIGVEGTGSVGATNSVTRNHVEPYRSLPGHEVTYIDYPGSIWPVGPYPYDQSREAGTQAVVNTVEAKHAECPDTEYLVIGHSQGAGVAGDGLERLHQRGNVPDDKLSGEGLSDPRTPNTGIEVVLPGIIPGYTMKNERGDMGNVNWSSQCYQGDPICDFPQPFQEPVRVFTALGDYFEKHGNYPSDGTDQKAPGNYVAPGPPSQINGTPVPAPIPGPELPDIPVPVLPPLPPMANLNNTAPAPYVPTPVSNYIPVEVQRVLPPEVNNFVPPPLPVLPPLPF